MKRTVIKIDAEKCDGCGLCVNACHEGAIGLIDGKAVLLREDYCDGLGDCLPACPKTAIAFEQREAAAYDEKAVKKTKEEKEAGKRLPCGCPSAATKIFDRKTAANAANAERIKPQSFLMQFPVQIKLIPAKADYFDGADLLIAADCTAFAYGNFHAEFIRDRITLVGCPKLDGCDYGDKLTEILKNNDVKSVTVVRMEVPCCGGITEAVKKALINCGKLIPWSVFTVTRDGRLLR